MTTVIWLLLVFLAPVFYVSGGSLTKFSSLTYLFFSNVCHQIDDRSFHIFHHKLGVCSRCFSIYIGFLIGAVVYGFRKSLNSIYQPNLIPLFIVSGLMTVDVLMDFSEIFKNTFISRTI
ncbi:MAG TPA: DUF2085 domain-containing protein, partial [Bacillales bacterium]|nr:DUF2085 domain-containing protein [Bacillales bacterium]